MTFLESFEVVRYRGIDGLSLPHLAPANLITGENGVGKTAVLEAMWLFTGRYNMSLLWNSHVQRTGKAVLNPVARLSKDGLELKGTEKGEEHSLKVSFSPLSRSENSERFRVRESKISATELPPVIGRIEGYIDDTLPRKKTHELRPTPHGSVIFQNHEEPCSRPNCIIFNTMGQTEMSDEYLQRYSNMVQIGCKQNFINAIDIVYPDVREPEILMDDTGESYLSAVTPDGIRQPLHNLGGGVVCLYRLFLDLFSARGGAVFADEVESGLHYSVLGEFWSHARVWMRQWDVQLVATTHSGECIQAAMTAFEDAPDELAIHKLYRNAETGRVEVATFTGEALEGARDLNLETR